MKPVILFALLLNCLVVSAQSTVDFSAYKNNGIIVFEKDSAIFAHWRDGTGHVGDLIIDLRDEKPLLSSIQLSIGGLRNAIAEDIDPVFVLTVGKRDLVSQNGWNIFFDRVPLKPFHTYPVVIHKRGAKVITEGAHTIIRMPGLSAGPFTGDLEITIYNGSPMFNIAAVMSTTEDSTAIIYDAGLVSNNELWKHINWSDVNNQLQGIIPAAADTATNQEVKYRTIVGQGSNGSLAVFPAPHQYFYPLDECFNLKFTWYGNNYRNLVKGYGIGIRQDLYGDRRYVPWFNAPPGTKQRLNFFCLIGVKNAGELLQDVKKFTHNDRYPALAGYKTMTSHFHIEHTQDVLDKKPMPVVPNFISTFKNTGVDIVHLAEFHGPGHPKGPAAARLLEQSTLFKECERLSDDKFLLLPGEEPNNFLGGHWVNFYPKPVYWIMSRKPEEPFVTNDPVYGKVYRVGNKEEMLKLLQEEKGLAWTAHARTKGSTGFPDKYKNEDFFHSERFMGAAWKAIPADLSQPYLGNRRILDLMDDMANWGERKHVIAEADLFKMEPSFEAYAHLNVNYLQLDKLPAYKDGWQPILDAMEKGRFFCSTGEILLPAFMVDGKKAGETLAVKADKSAINITIDWTFPLQYIDIVSGDGQQVYREHIPLDHTTAFGKKAYRFPLSLKGRKWVRAEVWDIAANGAFTQMVWLE